MTDEVKRIAEMVDGAFLFKTLEDGAKDELKQVASARDFAKGDIVIYEGDVSNDMFVIESGIVEVSTQIPGEELKLAELTAGAVLGEVAALTGASRTSTVTAKEAVRAISFPNEAVRKIAESYPKFKKLLERMIEGRARHTITLIPSAPE